MSPFSKNYTTILAKAKQVVPGFFAAYAQFFSTGTQKTKSDWKEISRTHLGYDPEACPCCKTGKMITILTFAANAPPSIAYYLTHKSQPHTYFFSLKSELEILCPIPNKTQNTVYTKVVKTHQKKI